MNYKIVSDSSSNLFHWLDVAYTSVPMKVIAGDKEYVDDPQLDVGGMVEDLKKHKGKSGSSCPNVQDWLDAYQGADRIFALTITGNLSGSYAAAVQAAQDYEAENPGAKVCVLDSLSAGPELGLTLDKLQQWILEGRDFDQIAADIKVYQSHTHLAFSLESLTNLARNGRVSPAVAKIAGVLGIRIMGVASDEGTLEPLHKCRGEKKALEAIVSEMEKRGYAGGKVRIAQCFNPNGAAQLRDMILSRWPNGSVSIEPCGALCSFYAERGGMLVGFEDAEA